MRSVLLSDDAPPLRVRHQHDQHASSRPGSPRASANASVSHFYYANRLKELVLGGFAVSLATAILPLLSRQALSPRPRAVQGERRLRAAAHRVRDGPRDGRTDPAARADRAGPLRGRPFPARRTRAPTADVLAVARRRSRLLRGRPRRRPRLLCAEGHAAARAAPRSRTAPTFVAALRPPDAQFGLPGIGFAASAAAAVNVVILLVVLRAPRGPAPRTRDRDLATRGSFSPPAAMGAALVAGRVASELRLLAGRSGGARRSAATIVAAALVYWFVASVLGAPEPAELRVRSPAAPAQTPVRHEARVSPRHESSSSSACRGGRPVAGPSSRGSGAGFLVLVGAEKGDGAAQAEESGAEGRRACGSSTTSRAG